MNDIIEDLSLVTKKDFTKEWENICWVLANECGWSQEDILNADIPFILALLNGRKKAIIEYNKSMKKGK